MTLSSDHLRAQGVLCVHNANPTRCLECKAARTDAWRRKNIIDELLPPARQTPEEIAKAALDTGFDKFKAALRDPLPKPGPGVYADHATIIAIMDAPSMNNALKRVAAKIATRKEFVLYFERGWVTAGRPKFRAPYRIKAVRVYAANMKMDPTNMRMPVEKYGIDCLVAVGCLPGDGWKHIQPPIGEYSWFVDVLHPRIEMDIEQVQEGS